MDLTRVAAVRELLEATGWVERTRRFGASLRTAGHAPGGLLVVGTPNDEPWHLTAHLDDEARYAGLAELTPTLVRWSPPPDAPAHLAVGMQRLEQARRGETVFVVASERAPAELLERVSDARHDGAVVLALDAGDRELESLAHEALVVPETVSLTTDASVNLVVPRPGLELATPPPVSFDLVTHLVSVAAAETSIRLPGGRRGLRDRVARLLDAVAGTRYDG